ncbi:MAG: hypothetical protein ACK4UV_07685, partial [Ignavibacterium sp.]
MKPFEHPDKFERRHIGPPIDELNQMAVECGAKSIDDLVSQTIPANIKLSKPLNIGEPLSEFEYLKKLRELASRNKIFKTYIGMGYYPTILPS